MLLDVVLHDFNNLTLYIYLYLTSVFPYVPSPILYNFYLVLLARSSPSNYPRVMHNSASRAHPSKPQEGR